MSSDMWAVCTMIAVVIIGSQIANAITEVSENRLEMAKTQLDVKKDGPTQKLPPKPCEQDGDLVNVVDVNETHEMFCWTTSKEGSQ